MAAFKEVAKSAGVDEHRQPTPGMVVRRGESNIVRLIGAEGLRLDKAPPPALTIEELKGLDLISNLASLGKILGIAAPPVLDGSRYVKISGKILSPSVDLKFVGGRGNQATVTVAVLGPRPVTLSVRPIQRRIPSTDALVWDSQQPFDLTAMLDRINTIWIPQANVVFTCRDTTPVLLDEAAVLKASGISNPEINLSNPDWTYTMDFVEEILNANRDQSANLTMFLVHQCASIAAGGNSPKSAWGVTGKVYPVCLISDGCRVNSQETMAHEAGHFLGRRFNFGRNFDHLNPNPDSGGNPAFIDCLMKDGGSSTTARIPYDDAVNKFNQPGASYPWD